MSLSPASPHTVAPGPADPREPAPISEAERAVLAPARHLP